MDKTLLNTWLEKRGVSKDTQAEFNIHIGSNNSIVIPVTARDGSHLFNKYRRSPLETNTNGKKYWYDPGNKAQLFGLHQVNKIEATTVVITEGELDCLLLWSHNIPAVSSTGGAGTFKSEWWEHLRGKTIIVAFDNDKAGGNGMARLWRENPDIDLVFVPDDAGIKDLTDYHKRGFDVRELIETAYRLNTTEEVAQDQKTRVARIEQVHFHNAILEVKKRTPREYVPRDSNDEIEKAKQVPITRITNMFNKRNDAICCPFHNEKTPSFHYFIKTNTCYCFGCNKFADSIDMYRHEHSCGFVEAIRELNKML